MLFDTHLHTKYSADSDMLIKDAVSAAKKLNVGLVLTEHLDYDFPGDTPFEFDPQRYMAEYAPYRGQNLRLGVEIGMQSHTAQRSAAFAQSADFDEVICSLHVMDGQDLYYKSCYEGKNKTECYAQYLTAMAELIAQHDFADILGHIDYICRYAPFDPPDILLSDCSDLVDNVWRTILDKEIIPELNTRRFDKSSNIAPLLKLYERYARLGGRYISLGSDAHTAPNVGFKLREAADMALSLGLRPVYFSERQMQLCKL